MSAAETPGRTGSPGSPDSTGSPDIRVVRGEPTPEELAALLAVWAGAGQSAPAPGPAVRRSHSRGHRWRRGPGLWRRGGRDGWTTT